MPIRQPAQPSILLEDDRPKLVERDKALVSPFTTSDRSAPVERHYEAHNDRNTHYEFWGLVMGFNDIMH